MMTYKEGILNILLDKYEKSKHYYGDSTVQKRVLLKFSKDFPEYEIENTEKKCAVHSAVEELTHEGVLQFAWAKFEEGNLLDSAWLVLPQVGKAYELVGRKPKQHLIEEVMAKLIQASEQTNLEWIRKFLAESISYIEAKKELPRLIPAEEEALDGLLAAFSGLRVKGEEEMLERIFSRKYLGGSKIFEKRVRARLVNIVKEYCFTGEDVEDEDAIQEVGLIKTSEELLFCGPLVIELNGNKLDFLPFTYGAAMNSRMIKHFAVESLQVKRVLTIENKANYLDMVNKGVEAGVLVIYLAGFYSPVKRLFLQKIYDYLRGQQVEFYHWGDIDLGGFRIFRQVQAIIANLRPWRMDLATIQSYAEFCDSLDVGYLKKLQEMLGDEVYREFAEVIEYMLEKKVRLEQEALI